MNSQQQYYSKGPLDVFAGNVLSGTDIATQGMSDSEHINTKLLRSLVASFALTQKYIAASYGINSGVPDRRNNMSYFLEISFLADPLTETAIQTQSIYEIPRVSINTSRVGQLVSPSAQEYEIRWSVGIDSFQFQRDAGYIASLGRTYRPSPIAIICPYLQQNNGSRYLNLFATDSGTALSGSATTTLFGELPPVLEFSLGIVSSLATNSSGTLNSELLPLNFTDAWLTQAVESGVVPIIPGLVPTEALYDNSAIVSGTIRLFLQPTITPRVKILQ